MADKNSDSSWNLSSLYSSDNDPQMAKDRLAISEEIQKFVTKWQKRSDYLENPAVLHEALDDYENFSHHFGIDGKEGYYFRLRSALDQIDPSIKAKHNQISEFARDNYNKIQFFHLNVAKIPKDKQQVFLASSELKKYRHYLESIFTEAKFLLSETEERIIVLKGGPSYENWVRMTSSFLSKETRKGKSLSEILELTANTNKKTRDQAAKDINEILEKHSDVAEAELNAILENKKIDDQLRGFQRPDQGRHLSDDIDTEIVDTALSAVSGRFDIPKRFYLLQAKLLKLSKLEYHERTVPFGKIDREFPYEEAVSLISKVFTNLDPQFGEIFQNFIANGQIDVLPKKGKTGGAFCTYDRLDLPTFILLNYTSKLRDVLTIAHEFGHAINDELMRQTQNALNFGTPLSTAEVASTFMEDFVLQEILQTADDELRLSLMVSRLQDDVGTIFRQVAAYQFEQELHSEFRMKGYLSKHEIGKFFQKHMAEHLGSAVKLSPGSENWWIHWPHFRTFFYVYSYATGQLISKSLQNQVKQNPKQIVKVKEFLATGSADSPKNIFLKLGIDISDKKFWDRGLDEIEKLLNETEVLAKKLKKI